MHYLDWYGLVGWGLGIHCVGFRLGIFAISNAFNVSELFWVLDLSLLSLDSIRIVSIRIPKFLF